jgi:hypothetical protein
VDRDHPKQEEPSDRIPVKRDPEGIEAKEREFGIKQYQA